MEIVLSRRYRGPLDSANGGYACGRLAALVDAGEVEVTLRLPPPLDRPLVVERADGRVLLLDGGALVAEARPAPVDLDPPSAIMLADAGVHITGRSPSTRSDAVTGPKVSSAPPGPVATRLIGPAGTPLSTGAVVSVTVTLKLADDVLSRESLAVQVTTVGPSEKSPALAGTHCVATGAAPPATVGAG